MKRKIIPIKVQKTLLFIPFINFAISPIFLFNYLRRQNKLADFLKSVFADCLATFLCVYANKLFISTVSDHKTFLEIYNKIYLLYLVPIVWGIVLIKCQEKYFDVEK